MPALLTAEQIVALADVHPLTRTARGRGSRRMQALDRATCSARAFADWLGMSPGAARLCQTEPIAEHHLRIRLHLHSDETARFMLQASFPTADGLDTEEEFYDTLADLVAGASACFAQWEQPLAADGLIRHCLARADALRTQLH